MSDHKENWRDYHPPTIPIYFVDLEALKEMLEQNPKAISVQGLNMMLGYFEEFQKFEKAAVVRDALWKQELFAGESAPEDAKVQGRPRPDFDPPDDGHEWQPSEDGKHWMRKLEPEELKAYLKSLDKSPKNPFQ